MNRMHTALLASVGVLALATGASAAVTSWTGANSSWFTATNWSGGAVPAATDVVTVGNGNTSAIDGARATAALTSLTISGGSTVDLQSRGTLTAATIMVGSGTTAGTLLMSGSNNVTGTIALNGGALTNQVSGGSQTNAITLTGTTNTISTTGAGSLYTVSGVISGTGALTVAGTGQTTITNNETYTGGTTVNSGAALSLGQGTAAGSVVGNITDNGTVSLNHNAAFTFGGTISGTGALTSIGANTLTAANTYSGLTQISTSTLFLTGAGSIANSSLISFSGAHSASLDISGITAATTSVKGLSSCNACTGTDTGQIAGGTVNLGAKNLTITGSPSLAYLGNITGTGSLTVSGSQTLSGANTYTGGTTINTGGQLTIGNSGTTGSIVGDVVNNGIQLVFRRTDAVTYAGVISGSSQVAQLGTGTLTLTGANTFTGQLLINPGTVALSGNGSVSSALQIRTFGNFDISQTNSGTTVRGLEVIQVGTNAFTGKVFLGNKTLTISNANNTFNGFLQDGGIAGGTGGGVTLLAGTQIFGAANTYTGATTITGGTLALADAGSIATSAVTVQNGGTLTGTGASGATTVQSGGILTPGAATLTTTGAGTVGTMTVTGLTLNSGAIFNVDVNATAADKITDSGAASINGILNATFASGTYAAAQYALITSTGALSGTFANYNIANLPANFVSTLSYDAHDVFVNLTALSSSGTANVDSGTTTISGNQTTGGLSSSGSGGTVALSSGSTLTDNQNTNTTFSGNITGAGAVTKTGTGTLVLDGTNTYTGGTAINGGTLEIGDAAHPNAVIQGPVTVGSGGTLQGHGTINGAVAIGSGGNLQPGGTIGTVTVGSASFATGSTFTVETSATQADLLQATGAVTIGTGTKLALTEDAPLSSFARVTTYTIVQAGTGVTGTFGTVTSSSASFLPTVTYGANTVSVTLLRTDLTAALAVNANQTNAAAAVIAGGASALATPLAAMSDAGVQAAYGQLTGDIHASLRSAAVEDSRIIRDAVLDHMNAPMEGGTDVWAVGFGGYGSIASNGNASGLHHDAAGFIAGGDMNVGSGFRLGLGGAYSSNNASTSGHASTASGNSGHVLGYAGWSDGMVDLKLGGDYGWGTVNVSRTVAAYAQTDANRQDQQTGQVFGEFGYRIGGTPIEPYVDLASISATTGAFAETGGSAALSGAQKTDTQTYSTVGLRVSLPTQWAMPHFDIGWQHAFNNFVPGETQTLQTISQSFAVLGAPLARDAATVRAGVGMAVSQDATLSVDYDGSVGGRVQNNAVRGGLEWRF